MLPTGRCQLKCPRCGADNAEQAPWCSLCQYAFQEQQGGMVPPEQQYESPSVPYQQQAQVPPPGVPQQQGYGPPPGAYSPGNAPPESKRGLSGSTRVLAGIIFFLLFFALVGGGLYYIFHKTAQIQVTPPPGWKDADEKAKETAEDSVVQGNNVKMDYLFSDGTLTNTIVTAHGDFFQMQTPDSDKYEDVKAFFEEHEDEYINQLKASSSAIDAGLKTTEAEVVEMACGIGAIHVGFAIRANGISLNMDYLDFYKKGSEYVTIVVTMGNEGNQEEVDHLINN